MSMKLQNLLSDHRIEKEFRDGKPLYTKGEALAEANRCLFCFDAPCVAACPTTIDIPAFIRKISTGNVRGSARTIWEANLLGYSCGRVCPVDELCVGACVYTGWNQEPIRIGRLQRFATETQMVREKRGGSRLFVPKPKNGKKVALIGAGPASLACAAYLALEGVSPVIFEKKTLPGGLNTTGIAPYKMSADGSLREIEWLLELGFDLRTGVPVSKDRFEELVEEYDAVFLGVGLGADRFLGIPNETGAGVFGATALIERIKNDSDFRLPKDVGKALVVGGGNTAIDIARELAMLGVGEVALVYRRTEQQMPGYSFELNNARKYGVQLLEHCVPVEVLRQDGKLTGLRVRRGGHTLDIPCDWLVEAIGQDKFLAHRLAGVATNEKGWVLVDRSTGRTSREKVYAGGDCVNGGKEVVNAVAHGRDAARAMLHSWST